MESRERTLDNGATFWGFFFGLVIGGVVTLLRGPRIAGTDPRVQVRETLDALMPADPISESIAEGKAAARRRLAELNQGVTPPQ